MEGSRKLKESSRLTGRSLYFHFVVYKKQNKTKQNRKMFTWDVYDRNKRKWFWPLAFQGDSNFKSACACCVSSRHTQSFTLVKAVVPRKL